MTGHEWGDDIPEWGAGADNTEDGKGRGRATCDLHTGISTLVTGAGQARLIRNLTPPMLGTDSGRCRSVSPEFSGWEAQEEGEKVRGSYLARLCAGTTHTLLLVLLNQEPQAVWLRQSHINIHAEVVGARQVLAAQVSVRGKGMKGRGRRRSSQYLRLVPELPQRHHICHYCSAKGLRTPVNSGAGWDLKGPPPALIPRPQAS